MIQKYQNNDISKPRKLKEKLHKAANRAKILNKDKQKLKSNQNMITTSPTKIHGSVYAHSNKMPLQNMTSNIPTYQQKQGQQQPQYQQSNFKNKKNNITNGRKITCVWRTKKGGERYYVGLDGKHYFGKDGAIRCCKDKELLLKLEKTRKFMRSPSIGQSHIDKAFFKAQMFNNNNDSNNTMFENQNQNNHSNINETILPNQFLNFWKIPDLIVEKYENKG